MQLQSKETDNARLNIKIKRLEKTNDLREKAINQHADNIMKTDSFTRAKKSNTISEPQL